MLPYNRALHPDDYRTPELSIYHALLTGKEQTLQAVGAPYRKDHQHREWEYANILRQLTELKYGSDARILDTGSGASYFPPALRLLGYTGVEVSDSMAYGSIEAWLIEQCQKLGIEIPLVVADITAMPQVPSESYDVTCCVSTIEHVAEDKFYDALRELWRITKPGGHLMITSDYFNNQQGWENSPFRSIQHVAFTEDLVRGIPNIIPVQFVGGVDLAYRGDHVNTYSFVNLCLQKQTPRGDDAKLAETLLHPRRV